MTPRISWVTVVGASTGILGAVSPVSWSASAMFELQAAKTSVHSDGLG